MGVKKPKPKRPAVKKTSKVVKRKIKKAAPKKVKPKKAQPLKKSGKNKSEPSLWTRFLNYCKRSPGDPIKTPIHRIRNILVNNHRGVLGFLIGLACVPRFDGDRLLATQLIYAHMLIYWVFAPVFPPATALIPIFMFPLFGVLTSDDVCQCYFNENIALFVIGGMLILLLNNCGFDRRVALYFICSGDSCQFSGKRLVFKTSTAAFIMSMFSNRLLVTNSIMELTTPILMNMQQSTIKYRGSEVNFDKMRHIINNAIQTSSVIGSLVIMHASFTSMAFKAIWSENPGMNWEYADIFNYLQYTAFMLPVACAMFFLNVSYNMLMINWITKNPTSSGSMVAIKEGLKREKAKQKKISTHEKISIFFTILMLCVFFSRYCTWSSYGWANRVQQSITGIPIIKDATVAALFMILLSALPKDFHFLKYYKAKKEEDLPPLKPASSILWWRYVDMNTNYAYIFLIGSGVALNRAIQAVGLHHVIANNIGAQIASLDWNLCMLLMVLFTALFANLAPGVAVVSLLLPFFLAIGSMPDRNDPWTRRSYLVSLGVGIAASFGFMSSHRYQPSFFSKETGKSSNKMIFRLGFGSLIICSLILWLALCFYAPSIFDPNGYGFSPVMTYVSPEAPPQEPEEGAPPPPPPEEPED